MLTMTIDQNFQKLILKKSLLYYSIMFYVGCSKSPLKLI
jgi:hypothetical protein